MICRRRFGRDRSRFPFGGVNVTPFVLARLLRTTDASRRGRFRSRADDRLAPTGAVQERAENRRELQVTDGGPDSEVGNKLEIACPTVLAVS